jgi:uncharacterized protein YjbJ (UPF0337 family)
VGRKSSGQDKAEAALDKAKGSVKEAAGRLTGDEALEAEGKVDKVKGDEGHEGKGEGPLQVGKRPVIVVGPGSFGVSAL